jgi:hypothetical protein
MPTFVHFRRVAGNNRWVVIGVRAAKADNTP